METVVAASHELDVALVRVRLGSHRVRIPRISDLVHAEDRVSGFRVAPPLASSWHPFSGIVCTSGVVLAVSPWKITVRGEQFFVPGSSGSPVFDAHGRVVAIALEMVNWSPRSGTPEWTYTALPIRTALSAPRLPAPLPVAAFLKSLRR